MGIYFLWPLLQGRRITLGQRTEVKQECIQLHYILQGVHLCEHSSPKTNVLSKCIIKRYLPQVQRLRAKWTGLVGIVCVAANVYVGQPIECSLLFHWLPTLHSRTNIRATLHLGINLGVKFRTHIAMYNKWSTIVNKWSTIVDFNSWFQVDSRFHSPNIVFRLFWRRVIVSNCINITFLPHFHLIRAKMRFSYYLKM